MTKGQIGRIAAAAALMAAVGCGDVTTDPTALTGTYDLVEVNGQALPALLFEGERPEGYVIATAISGTLTLRSTRFTERVVVNLNLDGADLGSAPVELSGDYIADGQLLSFDPDGASVPSFTGTVSGGLLTTVEDDPDYGVTEYVWNR
ncbi:MAG TPA: hypothetical protein VF039_02975 [Longimicrobiales bacterium]